MSGRYSADAYGNDSSTKHGAPDDDAGRFVDRCKGRAFLDHVGSICLSTTGTDIAARSDTRANTRNRNKRSEEMNKTDK